MELPLLLYFASIKTADAGLEKKAVRELKKTLRSKRAVNWPGPLGEFVLDRLEESGMLARVSSQPILKERQSCQAAFGSALRALSRRIPTDTSK